MSIPYDSGEALTCAQIRELDVLAIEHVGISGLVLMENAGRAAAELIYALLPNPRRSRALILCGPGNNGGDGFVVARHLANAEVNVRVVLAVARERYRGDAAVNLKVLERMDVALVEATPGDAWVDEFATSAGAADVIVDALLGTGSSGAPRPPIDRLIRIANGALQARRVAIDLPSGLDGDTGRPAEPCFRADLTITLVAPKVGFAAAAARQVLGRVVVADIGAPRKLIPGRKDFQDPLDRLG